MPLVSKINELKNRQGFMRYFKNTSWLLGEKILRMAVGLFVGIWVVRYLGPEQFGLLSYAQSFVFLFTAFATLGLDGIVVRELVKDESKRDELLGTAFTLKLIGAVIVLLMLTLIINIMSADTQTKLLIIIIASATLFQSMNVVDFYFQSKVLSRYVAFANTLTLFVSSVVKIWLIVNDAPLVAFAAVVLLDSVVLSLGFLYTYLKVGGEITQWTFNKHIALNLLKDSWPLILSGLVVSIYMRIDQVMIKEMLNAEAVGQYAAAVRLSEAWYFIPMVIASSLFPAMIEAIKQSEELYCERLQKLYDLMVWLAIAIALPMTFLSDWLVNLLYGEQYSHSQAGSVLMIHIWAGVFVFLGVASGKWFVVENLNGLSFLRAFYGMLVNVLLNIIMIPKYGVIGAAISTFISQCMAAYIWDFFHIKTRVNFWMKTKSMLPIRNFIRRQ